MTTKRGLITDSFKVVKKARRGGKREKRPTPPPPQKDAEIETVREEDLQKLRQFDLDWRFGPCTGISRLQRWERAKLHGLNPPEEIRDLLLETHSDPKYNLSLWSDCSKKKFNRGTRSLKGTTSRRTAKTEDSQSIQLCV